jgi:glycosyltransferase involved in cell wall biosynthesis
MPPHDAPRRISVIIPAHNAAPFIARVVTEVRKQRPPGAELDVIVVDDGSTDDTAGIARAAGARALQANGPAGNPAAARNQGAAAAGGDPLIFLDADCIPGPGWLTAILAAHDRGATIVGGSLDLPPGLPASARCDYYCGWYLVHSRRPAGPVPHHPPPNLSVRRDAFRQTAGFTEHQPFSYTNEERAWQAQLLRAGHTMYFEPQAVAYHYNRPGFVNLLTRSYRWAYTAVESKFETGATRFPWLHRHPRLVIAASLPLAFAHTGFILGCWVRAGVFEPVVMAPAVLAARLAYAAGMAVGGVQWLRRRRTRGTPARYAPRWQ